MKKIRIYVAAAALVLTAGGTFAFKAHSKFGTGNLFEVVGGVCTLNTSCASGSGTIECSNDVTWFSTKNPDTGDCEDQVSVANTHTVSN